VTARWCGAIEARLVRLGKLTQAKYNVTLVSDAHSTTDNAVLTAQQTNAYHNHILLMVWSDEHGEVVAVTVKPTNDIFADSS
jgi:hypothetical protein